MYRMGWIKIHRKMLDWEWYKDINTKIVFIHLLLVANFEDNEWQGMIIKRGQRFTSVNSLSTELMISCKAVRTALKKLRKGKQIDTKTANNGTMITICKYDEYQLIEKPKGKRRANETTIEGQQIKKDIEEVIIYTWRGSFSIYQQECSKNFERLENSSEFISKLQHLFPNYHPIRSLHISYEFWSSEAGWINKKDSKTVNIDWQSTIIRNFEKSRSFYTDQEKQEMK